MNIAWTKHITDPVEKEQWERTVLSAKPVLRHLIKILEGKRTELERSETSLDAYENANWAYKQAHKNGYHSSLNSTIKLLDL